MVSRDIKIATKKKFKPQVKRYKNILKENTNKIDIKYFKEKSNLDILDARLKVLYEKGMFRDADNAKKIVRKYSNIIKIANDIFLSRSKEIAKSDFYYTKPDFKEKYHDALIKRYTAEIKKFSQKGLKINFIEEIEPYLESFTKSIQSKFGPGKSGLN